MSPRSPQRPSTDSTSDDDARKDKDGQDEHDDLRDSEDDPDPDATCFIPSEDIAVEVLAAHLQAYVDPSAQIERKAHPKNAARIGYVVRAKRMLATEDLIAIISDSKDWATEQQSREYVRQKYSYLKSDVLRKRRKAGFSASYGRNTTKPSSRSLDPARDEPTLRYEIAGRHSAAPKSQVSAYPSGRHNPTNKAQSRDMVSQARSSLTALSISDTREDNDADRKGDTQYHLGSTQRVGRHDTQPRSERPLQESSTIPRNMPSDGGLVPRTFVFDGNSTMSIDRDYQPIPTNLHKRYFRPGRIFAVAVSAENISKVNGDDFQKRSLDTKRGGRITVYVGHMAVTEQTQGSCYAVPITTYDGKGLTHAGLSKSDIMAHAIIYLDNSSPERLPNEPKLNKRPIEIELASGVTNPVTKASRINFSRIYTVALDAILRKIGDVSIRSMQDFEIYARTTPTGATVNMVRSSEEPNPSSRHAENTRNPRESAERIGTQNTDRRPGRR